MMSNINERLDKLKDKCVDPNFLLNKGLGNEVGIYIFGYEPEDEMTVRYFLGKVKEEKGFRAIQYDLYDLFINNLKERGNGGLIDRVLQLEERSGKDSVEKQLKNIMPPKLYVEKMKYDNHQHGDVVMISGVGKVYPFTRVHTLLENIANEFKDVPVVVFYPGKYDGKTLTMFNKFFDDNHYRSFILIN